jgi:hypothetical protein
MDPTHADGEAVVMNGAPWCWWSGRVVMGGPPAQIPCGNDNKKSKGEKQIPFGNDNEKNNGGLVGGYGLFA